MKKNVYGTDHQHVHLVTCLQIKAIETPTYWQSRNKGSVYPWILITWITSITRGSSPRKSRWTGWYWQWRSNRKGWSRCSSWGFHVASLIFIKKDQHQWLCKRATSQLSSSVFDLFFISTCNNLNFFLCFNVFGGRSPHILTQLFLLNTSEQKTEDPDIRKHIRIHKASNMCFLLRIDCFPV